MSALGSETLTRRIVGFMAHLRLNDFTIGPAETRAALALPEHIDACAPRQIRLGFRSLLAGRREEWERFDDLFEAYWHHRGKTRERPALSSADAGTVSFQKLWRDQLSLPENDQGNSPPPAASEATVDDGRDGTDGLAASKRSALAKTDFRHIIDRQELAEAEELAAKLARAMRDRRSRRLRVSHRGRRIDLRRTIRRNLCHGGEPIELVRRRRPDRPVRIVVLLDVSGSMKQYSRFFLQFIKGLVGSWAEADAYVFHTRLVRVTDALRDKDPIRSMTRLSLIAQGFGGGTRIGASLRAFNDRYAKQALNSRSVVIILSDGYDTGEVPDLVHELKRLRRKARRIVWLNPLLGWRDYEPVARAMAAALPHIDCFAAAHSLEALSALEGEFARL